MAVTENRRDFSVQIYGRKASDAVEEVDMLYFTSFSSGRLDHVHEYCKELLVELKKRDYVVTAFAVFEYTENNTVAGNTVLEVFDAYFNAHTTVPGSIKEIRDWFDQSGLQLSPQ